MFNIENGEQLTKLYLKSDVVFIAEVIEKFVKVSIEEYDINLLYCVSLPCYTYQIGMKNTDTKLQTVRKKI